MGKISAIKNGMIAEGLENPEELGFEYSEGVWVIRFISPTPREVLTKLREIIEAQPDVELDKTLARAKQFLPAERVLDLTGCATLDDLEEWFSGMTAGEILQSCNDCWPGEDNEQLAEDIEYVMENMYFARDSKLYENLFR